MSGQLSVPDVEAFIDALGHGTRAVDADVDRIELVAALERVKGAAAAAQARLTEAFARSQRSQARLAALGVAGRPPGEVEAQANRSVWGQVALARRESPRRGQVHVGLAAALVREMPATLAALACGELTEWQATLVVRETAVLSVEDRSRVDHELAGRLGPMGDKRIADEARRIADRLDPGAALRRLKRAEADRRVTVRAVPGPMARLTGVLPVAQGVAAYAALRKHAVTARTAGDRRSLGQIMADELCARILGQSTGTPGVEIGLVMTERTLLRGGQDPAVLTDATGTSFGHVPAVLARRIVRDAHKSWVRRLYTSPQTGQLMAMDSRRRVFTGALRKLIVWRDQTCRMPWCEAPVRHVDHVRAAAQGGQTEAGNGQGLCEACNYLKEAPGWRADVVDIGPRGVVFTTPLGHRYPSQPPPPPGHARGDPEEQLRRNRDDWADGMRA